jgi:hypothetical protein
VRYDLAVSSPQENEVAGEAGSRCGADCQAGATAQVPGSAEGGHATDGAYHGARPGVGLNGANLSKDDRTAWRRQALDWMRADLTARAKPLEGETAVSRELVNLMVANWKTDPELAGLRERSAMHPLSTDERNECLALWHAVDNLLTRSRGEVIRAEQRACSLGTECPAPCLNRKWETGFTTCARRSDDTEARNDFVGCFGRSDRSPQLEATARRAAALSLTQSDSFRRRSAPSDKIQPPAVC